MIKTFPHQDKTLFVEALNFTSSQTGFRQTLIEKDYYCSLVLSYFFDLETNLVFKGGTCLNKKSLPVLKRQLITELKPVLRDTDFNAFNLEETMSEIQKIVEKLEYQKRSQ